MPFWFTPTFSKTQLERIIWAGFIGSSAGRICTAHITELNIGAQINEAAYSYILTTELHRDFIAAC